MDPAKLISSLINSLTDNEDQRQDLWVHYLSGNPPSSFVAYLNKSNKAYAADREIAHLLWHVFNNPPSEKFQRLLSNFSDIEQSVICLLALGLSVTEVSGYKGISEIRIKQVISIVRENDCWEELYGVKEKTHG